MKSVAPLYPRLLSGAKDLTPAGQGRQKNGRGQPGNQAAHSAHYRASSTVR